MKEILANRSAAFGFIVIAIIGIIAILAPLLAPYDPIKQDYSVVLNTPDSTHLFGTDSLGRDVLSRLMYGARTSMAVGVFSQVIILIIGLTIGSVSGFFGGKIDMLLMRFTDIVMAFPDLLFILLVRAILGGSIPMMIMAIGVVAWCPLTRLIRGQILLLKEREFVDTARIAGAGNFYIIIRHLIPNAFGPVLVALVYGVPRAIFAEAALSYIGIGVQPPTPSWGTMIHDGYNTILSAPYLATFPALATALLLIAFIFLGDGLHDIYDPKTSRTQLWGFKRAS